MHREKTCTDSGTWGIKESKYTKTYNYQFERENKEKEEWRKCELWEQRKTINHKRNKDESRFVYIKG